MAKKEQVVDRNDPKSYFIINTATLSNQYQGRDFEYWDVESNTTYRNMKAKVKEQGSLKEDYPHIDVRLLNRAENFHMMEHITPDVIKANSEIDGSIWVPKDNVALAKKIFKELHTIDNDVSWHPFGAPAPDMTEDTPLQSPIRQKLRGRL